MTKYLPIQVTATIKKYEYNNYFIAYILNYNYTT